MTSEPSHRPSLEWRIFPAAVIVGVGVLFLLNNLGYSIDFLTNGNWWALFILIAAAAPLSRAWEVYRAHGRLDAEAGYYLLVAACVVVVAVMFLMGLDWGIWWPLFVILGGLFTLVHRPHHRRRYDDAPAPHRRRDDDATLDR